MALRRLTDSTRLVGHSLMAEGAAFDDDGERVAYNTVGGMGRGRCSCGEMSEPVPSGLQRQGWHSGHKKEIRAALAAQNRAKFG